METRNFSPTGNDRPWRLVGAALALLVSLVLLQAAPAHAVGKAPSCYDRGISFTNVLTPGECIVSSNKLYEVVMQNDGNLVEYNTATGRACWASSWYDKRIFVAGDRAYLEVTYVPTPLGYAFWYTTLRVGHQVWWGIDQTYARTDKIQRFYWQPQPDLNASINKSGQLYVGYLRLSSGC